MALITFTRNYTDRSNDNGFQCEFHCDKCGNGRLSRFQTSKLGVLAKIVQAIAWLSGRWWSWGFAGYQVKDIFRGKAWDAAYETAVAEAKRHFKSCQRCGQRVCPERCWNDDAGLCEGCAPDLRKEAAGLKAQVAREQMREKILKFDQTAGVDPAGRHAVVSCPECGHAAHGDAFCSQCGHALTAAKNCPKCHTRLAPGCRFCGACGSPALSRVK
jgi:hypothetical protein